MREGGRLQVIDAHVHLWDLASHPWYPAMQQADAARAFASLGDVTRMARDFLIPQLRHETGAVELLGLVHVSAVSAPRVHIAEAAWLAGVLDELGLPAATIGAVEATQTRAEMEADLDAQAADRRFRGVRVLVGLQPTSDAAATLCGLLEERDLVFDLVTQPGAAAEFATLLEGHPGLHVVVEHAGWPSATHAAGTAEWRTAMDRLAALPHVNCKISGLGMATHSLQADVLRPWIDGCLEAFGAERCMFGGNFPVDAMYGDYQTLIDSLSSAVSGLSNAERHAFFVGNARRAYRLADTC